MTLLHGDSLAVLPTVSAGAAHACVTSPPYYGLRDYGVPPTAWPAVAYAPMHGLPSVQIPAMTCALGLEDSPEAYVGHLLLILREVHRILPATGALLLNIGDSWAAARKSGEHAPNGSTIKQGAKLERLRATPRPAKGGTLGKKQLLGIPWRVAFALQADGWVLRQEIVWHKPNPQPESVTDRCTKAHEHVFLLTKRATGYYWDGESIAEAATAGDRGSSFKAGKTGEAQYGQAVPSERRKPEQIQATAQRPQQRRAYELFEQYGFTPEHLAAVRAVGLSSSPRRGVLNTGAGQNRPEVQALADEVRAALGGYTQELLIRETRNARSVWRIPTQPFADAHFAVMAAALAERCVLAVTPPGGTVLDPFAGSGTTGRAAWKHGREFLGVELLGANVDLAQRHLRRAQPGLSLIGLEVAG